MRLLLGPELDGALWTGSTAAATFGEAYVGPLGFVDRLETALGLRSPPVRGGDRAAALVPALHAQSGFWSASAETDPLGVARELLRWRDTLRLHGWRGGPCTPRIAALASLTADVSPGLADRLERVAAAITTQDPEIESVGLFEAESSLPVTIRAVLAALRSQGTAVGAHALGVAPAAGDVGGVRDSAYTPVGDGSLQLVRAVGPLEAAEQVAAYLAADPAPATVIIGSDAVLDAALRRHGLPTTGGPDHADGALLQLLPLVLELGWAPTDPRRALEFLTLPLSPIPRRVAGRLAGALQKWPAVDSTAWREALALALEAEEPDRRAAIVATVGSLLVGTAPAGTYPASEARRRVDTLARWLQGRLATVEEGGAAFAAAFARTQAFRRLLDRSGLDPISAPQLRRMVEDAVATTGAPPPCPPQAGLRAIAGPAAVLGAVPRVVWWSFHEGAAPAPSRLPLTEAERRGLAEAGVQLLTAAEQVVAAAERWRRPLRQTTECLVLVCPERGEDGEVLHPHPLWDELVARHPGAAQRLTAAAPRSPRAPTVRVPLGLPVASRTWSVPAGHIKRRESDSPSSLASLLGCSLQWAFQHAGQVYPGRTASLPEGSRLWGTLVHEIVAGVLRPAGAMPTPEAAAAAAVARFDEDGPRLAALLFQPGAQVDRQRVRRVLERATAELVRRLAAAGLTVQSVETTHETPAMGGTLKGTPDLVARGPHPVVVDLKWGGGKYRRDELQAGVSTQLAAYAHLVRPSATAAYPPVAYYILGESRLYSTDHEQLPGAVPVAGPSAGETWLVFERAWRARWAQVVAGVLEAPGVVVDENEPALEASIVDGDGNLRLAPPCGFCDYAALCGLRSGE